MKISELIKNLAVLQTLHGDLDVRIHKEDEHKIPTPIELVMYEENSKLSFFIGGHGRYVSVS